jgi:hypothetical protein
MQRRTLSKVKNSTGGICLEQPEKPKNSFWTHGKSVIHQTGFIMKLYIFLISLVISVFPVDNCFFQVSIRMELVALDTKLLQMAIKGGTMDAQMTCRRGKVAVSSGVSAPYHLYI